MVIAVNRTPKISDKCLQNNDLMELVISLLLILKNPVVEIAAVATRVSPYTHASFQGCPTSTETVSEPGSSTWFMRC
jgi:hypothetical protein